MNLEISNLSVHYKKLAIINDLSFSLASEQSLSVIGPSGSGKTTLIKTILGIINPYTIKGTIIHKNIVIQKDQISTISLNKRKFSYIPQNLALWPHLTVLQTLQLTSRFAHKQEKLWPMERLIELCQLGSLLHRYPKTLSGGEKQRLALARALSAQPHLLILDEPFSALDVVAKAQLIDLIKSLKKLFTVLFISHHLPESLAIGDKLLILENGRAQWFGSKDQLTASCFSPTWNPYGS